MTGAPPGGLGQRELRRWQFLLAALLLGYLLAFSVINFQGLTKFINPDMYSDTLIARYMWEEKTLFPSSWVFGNQFYVVATPVLAALFYGLTGSVNLGMALATTVMTLLLLAALAWLLRGFCTWTQTLAGLTALVSSVLAMNLRYKLEGQLLFVLASYYSCYLLTLLVVWGDYTHSLFHPQKPLLCPSLLLGMALGFGTGMQSIRQTCIMIAPLLAFEGLRVAGMLLGGGRRRWGPTLRVLLHTGANLGGVVFIRALHIPSVSIYGSLGLVRPEQFLFQLKTLLWEGAKTVGIWWYQECSPSWFVIAFSLTTLALVLAALGRSLVRFVRGRREGLAALLALCVLSLGAVAGSGLVLELTMRSPYLFVWYLLVCLSAVSLVGTERAWRQRGALALLCVLAASNLWYSYAQSVRISLREEDSAWSQAAQVLMEGDYEILYGRFWDTGIICAHTDGRVEFSPWFTGVFQSLGYLCPQDLRDPEDNQRAAYLFLDEELEEAFRQAEERGAELYLVERLPGMSLYTASEQLMLPPELTAP